MKTNFPAIAILSCLATAAFGQTLHPEAKLDAPGTIDYAIVCEQATQIVGVGHDGAIYAWTLPDATPRKIAIPDGPVHNITCAGGSTLAAWLGGGKGLILDLNTSKVRSRIEPKALLYGLELSPEGSLLAVSNNADPVQLWDTHSGQKIATGINNFGLSTSAAFAPNGQLFVSTDADTNIRAYDRQGKLLYTADGGLLEPFAAAFTRDSKQFTAAGADGTISLYDAASGKKLRSTASSGYPIFSLIMSPDNHQVMALELDDFSLQPKTIGLWDLHSNTIHPVTAEAAKLIGMGANATHLLLIQQLDPKTITVLSLQ